MTVTEQLLTSAEVLMMLLALEMPQKAKPLLELLMTTLQCVATLDRSMRELESAMTSMDFR